MNKEILVSELTFKAVRSSGAGGQNVNKVSSKVMLSFNLTQSNGLNEIEKNILKEKLASKLTQDFILILNCDEDRSQLKNKSIVIKRFLKLLEKALHQQKSRIATKTPRRIIEKRLNSKKIMSVIKQNRKNPNV